MSIKMFFNTKCRLAFWMISGQFGLYVKYIQVLFKDYLYLILIHDFYDSLNLGMIYNLKKFISDSGTIIS